jgi:hypothetical protein
MYNRLNKQTTNDMFFVPNVGGWPGYNPPEQPGQPGGHRIWLSTDRLEARREWLQQWIKWFGWRDVAESITEDIEDPFEVAVELATYLLPLDLETLGNDMGEVELAHDPSIPPADWVENGPAYIKTLGGHFLDGLPHYNWPGLLNGSDRDQREAKKMIVRYVEHLVQRPEYHLC